MQPSVLVIGQPPITSISVTMAAPIMTAESFGL
jgi:hypothetical protein